MQTRHSAAMAGAFGLVLAGTILASPPGDTVVDQISEVSYRNFLDNMLFTHLGDSRGIGGADHHPARDNIHDLFLSYGLETNFETFSYSGTTGFNVVAELTGTTRPGDIYIIGAHYDSVSNPGADDNASGVAGVLEVARILSQYESEATIRFIAFDMEELGLIGSSDYASDHRNDNIRGMISMDMIAYDPNDQGRARLYGRTTPIKQALASALTEYGGITSTLLGALDASDHAPFEQRGFSACLIIENDVWDNPYYHQWNDSVDTPGYINYTYATDMTRGVAGWLVDAAGVMAFCAADFNGDGAVDTLDVLSFLNAWNAGDPKGDFNGDGVHNTLDVLAFLNAWSAGC
jgi:Zn-dependent M28 family amino/carboxypeptidase